MSTASILEPRVLAETLEWLVVDKPAGWISIPGRTRPDSRPAPVLSDWLRARFGPLWVVHRLDHETSGVLLFAKSAESHRKASAWWEGREIKKWYDALAEGSPAMPVFKVNTPIAGRPALTQIEVKEKFKSSFLARVRIITGKRHQIRIHMASLGHPLLGDKKYGSKQLVSRVALHSARLELPTHESFEAPWPEDFRQWVESSRKGDL